MAFVVQNHGEGDALRAIVAHTAATALILRLYSNNVTPAETDTAATYTEATFSGYAAVTLTGASWTITEGAPSDAAYAEQSFTADASIAALQNIYGAFMTRTTSGRIFASKDFSAARPVENENDTIGVTPTLTLD